MLPCWLIDNQLCYYYINEPDKIGGRPGVEPCPPVLQTGALPRELVGRLVNNRGWRMAEGGGIEPLDVMPTTVFKTACRPFSGTLYLFLEVVLPLGIAPRSSAYQASALLLSYRT